MAEIINSNRGRKVVDEALKIGWEMEEAEEKLKRKQMTRLGILQEARMSCVIPEHEQRNVLPCARCFTSAH